MSESEEFDRDDYGDDPPRGLLSTLWFRAVLVALVLGVIAVLAAPSLMDVATPPAAPPVADAPPTPASPAPGAAAPADTTRQPASPAAPAVVAQAVPPVPATSTSAAPASLPARTPDVSGRPDRSGGAVSPVVARVDTSGGPFWVQVGAFRDPAAAQRLAASLRQKNYRVQATAPGQVAGAGAADRYEVFIAGAGPAAVRELLPATAAGRAASVERVADGVVLRPALSLADALALSRALTGEGRRVQVRRMGGEGATGAAGDGAGLHRVRVGGYPDRAAAEAVRRELEGLGYRPFIARGEP